MKTLLALLALLLLFTTTAHAQDSARVQERLDQGGTWRSSETFMLETAVFIRVPGTTIDGPTFRAASDITGTRLAMIYAGYIDRITLRNVTIDGNRDVRGDPWYCDGTVNAYRGSNIHFDNVNDLVIDNVTTKNAACGSGMHVISKRARIINSTFAHNGLPNSRNHWADGLTALQCDQCVITDNLFLDNTDIGMVIGGARNSLIARNTIRQTVPAFAGLAMDNFNGSRSGDFRNAIITANQIECGDMCNFGMNIGPHAWYLSPNIVGGRVSANRIFGGKIPLLIGGAGTVDAPIHVYGNDLVPVLPPGTMAQFSCGERITWPIIVSPDSVAITRRESVVAGFHRECP